MIKTYNVAVANLVVDVIPYILKNIAFECNSTGYWRFAYNSGLFQHAQ